MTGCLCWVGHGDCGGCSGYPGITHEPACGWEWNPACPVHAPERRFCQTPGCGKPIERAPAGITSPTGYRHTASKRICCFDVYKPEYATPPPNDGYEPSGLDEFAPRGQR